MDPDQGMNKYPLMCIKKDLVLPQFVTLCEELNCGLCKNLVWNAVSCAKCNTPFGSKCLENWFKNQSKCPKGCQFEKADIPSLSKRMMSKIELNCINKNNGCNQVVLYENFYNHANTCQFRPLSNNTNNTNKVIIQNNKNAFDTINLFGDSDIGTQNNQYFSGNNNIQSNYESNNNNHSNNNNNNVPSEISIKNHFIYSRSPDDFAKNMNKNREYANVINKEFMINNLELFKQLITNNDPENPGGILYKDNNIEIEVAPKQMSKAVFGLLLTFTSSNGNDIENLAVIVNGCSEITVQTSKPKYIDTSTAQILVKVGLIDSFSNPPRVIFTCNLTNGETYSNHTLALPIFITKFIQPLSMKKTEFFQNWQKFTNNSDDIYHKFDCIVNNPFDKVKSIMQFLKKIGSLLFCLGFNVLRPDDTKNYHEIEAAGSLVTAEYDVPILIQMSFVPSYTQEFRLSIRSKVPDEFKYITLTLDIFSVIDFYVNFKK